MRSISQGTVGPDGSHGSTVILWVAILKVWEPLLSAVLSTLKQSHFCHNYFNLFQSTDLTFGLTRPELMKIRLEIELTKS